MANFSFFSGTFFGGRGGTVAAVANLIGFNQLYTGSPAGTCAGTGPNVMFAYGVSPEGGITSTSPALSEDGKQVAVVETTATLRRRHGHLCGRLVPRPSEVGRGDQCDDPGQWVEHRESPDGRRQQRLPQLYQRLA